MKRVVLAGILATLAVLTIVTVSDGAQAATSHAIPATGFKPWDNG